MNPSGLFSCSYISATKFTGTSLHRLVDNRTGRHRNPGGPMTPAELCEKHFPMIAATARRWAKKYPNLADEFESACNEALFRAAQKYQSDRGEFHPFAQTTLENACIDVSKLHFGQAGTMRQPLQLSEDEDGVSVGIGAIPSDAPPVGTELEAADLLSAVAPDVAELVMRHHGHGVSYAELARERDVTRQAIKQQVERAIKKIREAGTP